MAIIQNNFQLLWAISITLNSHVNYHIATKQPIRIVNRGCKTNYKHNHYFLVLKETVEIIFIENGQVSYEPIVNIC